MFRIISVYNPPTGYRQVANRSRTVGHAALGQHFGLKRNEDRRPTIGRQSANSRPTISFGNCSSLVPIFEQKRDCSQSTHLLVASFNVCLSEFSHSYESRSLYS